MVCIASDLQQSRPFRRLLPETPTQQVDSPMQPSPSAPPSYSPLQSPRVEATKQAYHLYYPPRPTAPATFFFFWPLLRIPRRSCLLRTMTSASRATHPRPRCPGPPQRCVPPQLPLTWRGLSGAAALPLRRRCARILAHSHPTSQSPLYLRPIGCWSRTIMCNHPVPPTDKCFAAPKSFRISSPDVISN